MSNNTELLNHCMAPLEKALLDVAGTLKVTAMVSPGAAHELAGRVVVAFKGRLDAFASAYPAPAPVVVVAAAPAAAAAAVAAAPASGHKRKTAPEKAVKHKKPKAKSPSTSRSSSPAGGETSDSESDAKPLAKKARVVDDEEKARIAKRRAAAYQARKAEKAKAAAAGTSAPKLSAMQEAKARIANIVLDKKPAAAAAAAAASLDDVEAMEKAADAAGKSASAALSAMGSESKVPIRRGEQNTDADGAALYVEHMERTEKKKPAGCVVCKDKAKLILCTSCLDEYYCGNPACWIQHWTAVSCKTGRIDPEIHDQLLWHRHFNSDIKIGHMPIYPEKTLSECSVCQRAIDDKTRGMCKCCGVKSLCKKTSCHKMHNESTTCRMLAINERVVKYLKELATTPSKPFPFEVYRYKRQSANVDSQLTALLEEEAANPEPDAAVPAVPVAAAAAAPVDAAAAAPAAVAAPPAAAADETPTKAAAAAATAAAAAESPKKPKAKSARRVKPL